MDTSRGRRGCRPARGCGHGRRPDVIQDTPVITDIPPAPIGFQQVGGDVPPAQDPPIVDPPTQDPPVGGPPVPDPLVGGSPVEDPPVHMVEDPDDIDEVMVGRVVWRLLQRAGDSHLEAL
ncbi:hypothetical protein GQ457_05G027510 [Hibiscus cannabinus]